MAATTIHTGTDGSTFSFAAFLTRLLVVLDRAMASSADGARGF